MNGKPTNIPDFEACSTEAEPEPVLLPALDIRIDAEGVWHWDGRPVRRKEMVCLLAQALCRDSDGSFWLRTPSEYGRVTVDDAPFQAVEMYVVREGREQAVSFRTNVDRIVALDARHGLCLREADGELRPYLEIAGGIEARLTRAVFYELVERGCEEELDGKRLFGVWSCGRFFVLGEAEA
ncbi:MAG: DUF1285 domain-containing protein [Magnetospirillum sp. WYHS-4]